MDTIKVIFNPALEKYDEIKSVVDKENQKIDYINTIREVVFLISVILLVISCTIKFNELVTSGITNIGLVISVLFFVSSTISLLFFETDHGCLTEQLKLSKKLAGKEILEVDVINDKYVSNIKIANEEGIVEELNCHIKVIEKVNLDVVDAILDLSAEPVYIRKYRESKK